MLLENRDKENKKKLYKMKCSGRQNVNEITSKKKAEHIRPTEAIATTATTTVAAADAALQRKRSNDWKWFSSESERKQKLVCHVSLSAFNWHYLSLIGQFCTHSHCNRNNKKITCQPASHCCKIMIRTVHKQIQMQKKIVQLRVVFVTTTDTIALRRS